MCNIYLGGVKKQITPLSMFGKKLKQHNMSFSLFKFQRFRPCARLKPLARGVSPWFGATRYWTMATAHTADRRACPLCLLATRSLNLPGQPSHHTTRLTRSRAESMANTPAGQPARSGRSGRRGKLTQNITRSCRYDATDFEEYCTELYPRSG